MYSVLIHIYYVEISAYVFRYMCMLNLERIAVPPIITSLTHHTIYTCTTPESTRTVYYTAAENLTEKIIFMQSMNNI